MSLHIVVIDDCPVILEMVKDYLAEAGFRVSTCDCSVYSNHLIYARQPPDLILLDVMLPLMSGTKKAKALKSRERSRDIPILLMSSKEEAELRTLTAMAGADGYLPKPFSAASLVRTIRSVLPA